jgi:hypothetical protein
VRNDAPILALNMFYPKIAMTYTQIATIVTDSLRFARFAGFEWLRICSTELQVRGVGPDPTFRAAMAAQGRR